MAESAETFVPLLDPAAADALRAGRHADPFAVLGPHRHGEQELVRAWLPGALGLDILDAGGTDVLGRAAAGDGGLFEVHVAPGERYLLRIRWPEGEPQVVRDPYSFGPLLSSFDLHLIAEGRHRELARCLGAQPMTLDGAAGVRFAVWAPNALRVSVVGDFNGWNGTRFPMRLRHEAGVWEIFLPGVTVGSRYKFELLDRHGQLLPLKADPLARATELPPATASIVAPDPAQHWSDHDWLAARAAADAHARPLSIYEMHVGSWLRKVDDATAGWLTLAEHLIPYLEDLGFTHVELMPIMEHPFGGSWGYQPLAQFAPTARFGPADDFALFVDRCHAAGIGVILDWVPAHFPTDAHGLARFDGTALYEYLDPREGLHRDWNTYIFNLGRNEVRGFLIASALFWFEQFHVDGLRVDAVASMLYRDYSRAPGEWLPNQHGGRENLEAIAFLRELNELVRARCPGALMIAEESTAWPGVTTAVAAGGLGFHYKWNMGWMHDTLRYMEHPAVHRRWHHDDMTFGMVYAYSEHFILPLSHDEVVYGKKSLLAKMPGDRWQQFAQLRAYLGFMWTHPGKKLLFMGGEIGQWAEWNHDGEIDWACLADPLHAGVQRWVSDLNARLRASPALYTADHDPVGFQWLIGDDRDQSVFAYVRRAAPPAAAVSEGPDVPLVALVNFTPVPRHGYRVGVPQAGAWRELLNSDAGLYGGSNLGNAGRVQSASVGTHGQPYSLELTLPPLALVLLAPDLDERSAGAAD